MKIVRYLWLVLNIFLLVLNLYFADILAYSYLNISILKYVEYIFADKKIILDESEINLPKGFFLKEITDNFMSGPAYAAGSYDLSHLYVEAIRPPDLCSERFLDNHLKQFYKARYISPEDATTNEYLVYEYGDDHIFIKKTVGYYYHYKFMFTYQSFIPERCMGIDIYGSSISLDGYLDIIKQLAFSDLNNEFKVMR